MKSVGLKMSMMMGATLSFCLSLAGNLASGHFTLLGFLLSFAASLAISLIIGFVVPMGKVTAAVDARLGLKPGTLPARAVNAVVSDLIYSPVITLAMVFLAWKRATANGAAMPFWPMYGRSLVLSLAIGFVLSFVLMPVYLKLATKRAGR